jgi:DUF438 domain-containing protein
MSVNQFMTEDHRACDEQFAQLENIVDSGNFDGAKAMFEEFYSHMINHFEKEEKVMFPKFNESAGEGCNPTTVMIMEHDQMRSLMNKMGEALKANDKEEFLGLSENLLFVMQQHNMKEEQIMYNLVDNSCDSDEIIRLMQEI